MKRKNIEAANKTKLWLEDSVVPQIDFINTAVIKPMIRRMAVAKVKEIKENIHK